MRFDPAFAASIEPTRSYAVLITPGGDTSHGLYVSAKTATGFVVREAQNGRSTVPVDYRIVATALGHAGQRMAAISADALPHVATPGRPPSPLHP